MSTERAYVTLRVVSVTQHDIWQGSVESNAQQSSLVRALGRCLSRFLTMLRAPPEVLWPADP